jgi:hypothetical protein
MAVVRAGFAAMVLQSWPFCEPASDRLAAGSEGRADAWLVRLPSRVTRDAQPTGGNQ